MEESEVMRAVRPSSLVYTKSNPNMVLRYLALPLLFHQLLRSPPSQSVRLLHTKLYQKP